MGNLVTISFRVLTNRGMLAQHADGADLGQVGALLLMPKFTFFFAHTFCRCWADRTVKTLMWLSKY